MLSKFWIHELTRPAFVEWLENESAPVAVIGIGSIEQHGPHLPLGTDSLACTRVSLATLPITWVFPGPLLSARIR